MADKSIDQLNEAEKIYATDLFVLQQSGSAKKLTGQVLLNWLTAAADGHGGIQSIAKLSTSGLVDTYRITLADTTVFDFVVNNGRGITGIAKTGTSGLVDTYIISYNNGTTSEFTVTNGAKGNKGDNAYVWIKYASQEPTDSSHSMGDIPDAWIGIYSGNASSAPSDWKQYRWFQIKGEKGDTGSPATLVTKSVTYQVSDSGTIIPSGVWVTVIPVVAQGKYLWTKTELQFNTGDPVVSYSVGRMGIDGTGAVSSVAGVSPGSDGNVALGAADIGAMPATGGDFTGPINMNGQKISGLNDPTDDTQAASKRYVDKMLPKSGGAMSGSISMGGNRITDLGTPTANTDAATKWYVDTSVAKSTPVNLLDNSDFVNLIAQAGYMGTHGSTPYLADRWVATANTPSYDPETRTITFSPDGLSIITQNVGRDVTGKTLTIAIKASSVGGTVFLTDSNAQSGHADVLIQTGITVHTFVGGEGTGARIYSNSGGSIVIDWIALYEGEYTADTIPEYRPKGYAAELAECMRYYYRISNNDVYGAQNPASLFNATTVRATFLLPVEMRINPTVSILSGSVAEWNVFTVDKVVHPTAYSVIHQLKNRAVNFVLTIPSKTTQTPAVLCITSSIDFNADL